MSRHKFVKTLNLNDELEDYDGVADYADDEGECVVSATSSQAPVCAAQCQTNATMKMLRQRIKVTS